MDRDICLTSGAGCGKTTVLTARFINALSASADTRVDELVAITFTDKAARQMRDRIRRACRVKMRRAETDAERRLWNQRLRDLDTARISTIHAFCGGLLRRHAVEAGIDPEFAVIEPLDAAPLLEAAVDDVLRQRLSDESDNDIRLLLDHYDLRTLTKDVSKLVAEKRGWIQHYIGSAQSLDAAKLVEQWRTHTQDALVRIARDEIANGPLGNSLAVLRRHAASDAEDIIEKKRRHLVEIADAFDSAGTADETIHLFGELLQMRGSGGGKKANWDEQDLKDVKEAMKTGTVVRKELGELFTGEGSIPEAAGQLAVALIALTEDIVKTYDAAKAARHAMDFSDLELGALSLLAGDEGLRREIAASCGHLLIDEFQDTSWLQVRLAELVCGEARGMASPRLLVVGDAKQSIYRFRAAEVEQFERFRETFPASDRLDLDISFRSHAGIVDFLNHFCNRFGGRLANQLKPQRTTEPGQPCVEFLFVRPDDEPSGKLTGKQSRPAEATAVARRLRSLLEEKTPCVWDARGKQWRGPQRRDIAMLFRASTDMRLYEDALLDEGIPYYVVSGGGFYGRQEIVDLRNLLTALTEPADEVALLGVLRSGMFSITDETLYWLCREPRSRPGQLWSRLRTATDQEGITGAQRERIAFAAETLTDLRSLVDRLPVAALLIEALRRTGYDAVTAALFDGRRRAGNLRRFVEHARKFDAAGAGGLAEFTERIDKLVGDKTREEQAPTQGESDDVVRLMTIHAAKGLEFPIVVLVDLNRRAPTRGEPIATLHDQFKIAVKVRGEDDSLTGTLPHRIVKRLDHQANREEEHRLLYVAATRAEDMLIVAGAGPIEKTSWLAELDDRLELHLAEQEHDRDLPFGEHSRASRVRIVFAAALRSDSPSRGTAGPKLFEAGVPQPAKLERLLKGADPAAAADILTACGPAPAVNRVRFGAKELSLAFAGQRPLVMGNRPVFVGESDAALSPSARGIVLHRALQEYRWTGPEEADQLVRQAAAALDVVGDETVDLLMRDLRDQLSRLAKTQLHATIAASPDRRAEAAFLLAMGDARVRGVIDLMYRDADGAWWVLDYKSDRVRADQVEAAVEKYKLQIQLYALAASRYARQAPIGAVFYFLHPGTSYRMELNAGDLEVAEENAVTTIRQLRAFEAARG